ncbi:MAG: YeiH family protein [Tolumonas sp.]|nr:YeiH family protein [Tolumonas sp.]
MNLYIRLSLNKNDVFKSHYMGLMFTAGVAIAGLLMSQSATAQHWGFSALTIAIALGIVLGNTVYPHIASACASGVGVAKQQLLRTGIVLYGLRITFQQIAGVGMTAIVTDFMVLSSTFLLAYWLGTRIFKLDRDTALLIGAGSSICGAAAVMATEPVVRAQASKVSIAVATVVVFGTAGMFLYPALYHLGLTVLPIFQIQNSYGVYAGSTIHEVAQVFAAGQAIGPKAADIAVIVKMIRVMMLAPFLLLLSGWLRLRSANLSEQSRKITIPWFAVFFVVMAGINSLQWLPVSITHELIVLDNFLLAMAMAALGLTTHLGAIRSAGLKPLMLGGILFMYLILGGGFINWLVASNS